MGAAGRKEAALDEKESFNEYHTAFAEVETTFAKQEDRQMVDAATEQKIHRLQL